MDSERQGWVERYPPRATHIPFCFSSCDEAAINVESYDASIRAARFSLTEQARIANATSGKATFGQIKVNLNDIELPDCPDRKDCFVITYKTSRLNERTPLQGAYASYEIEKFKGAGRSAETYKARVTSVRAEARGLSKDQPVIIKIPLLIPNLGDEKLREFTTKLQGLFTREEMNLRRLANVDCVANFLDSGVLQQVPTTLFMVQKLVDGPSLYEYLENNYADNGVFTGLPSEEFYRFGRALGSTIREVHSKLVIHGDVWPENILVNESKQPVLIDFGQAAFREAMGDDAQIEGRNRRYIAPEKTRSVGGDVYSLGGVLHYLATGENPPEEPPEAIDDLKDEITRTIRRRNDRLYKENRGAVDVIARCLRVSEQRTAHAHGVIEELDTFFATPSQAELSRAVTDLGIEGEQLGNNQLFRWMASLRVDALRTALSDMASGVYDLVGDHELIVAGLTQSMRLLGPRDQYLTISVPRIWRPDNLGVNGRFLSMNTVAAKRGAVVRRVFVITPADRKEANFRRIMDSQKRVVDELKELKDEELPGSYEVRVLDVSNEKGDEILKRGDHFGLLVKGKDEIAVFAEYRKNGSLSAVRFRAGQNFGLSDRREVFERCWNKATPLTDWIELAFDLK